MNVTFYFTDNSVEYSKEFAKVGDVDVLLDDGGHLFHQQIITAESAIPHIKDGGMLVTEDVFTSYLRSFLGTPFGGPSRHSMISYAINRIHGINFRFKHFANPNFRYGHILRRKIRCDREVFSMSFFDSVVAFHIDRRLAALRSSPITNFVPDEDFEVGRDVTHHADKKLKEIFGKWILRVTTIARNQLLGKYFKY